MPYTTDAFNSLLNLLDRAEAITLPATWYLGLHLMNTITAAAAIGDDFVEVLEPVTVGAHIVLGPETANEEEFQVLGTTGSGPYVLTLDGELAHAHAEDSEVLCDPGSNGQEVNEPSGAGYARVARTRNTTNFTAGSDGSNGDAADVSFPTISALLGIVTHWVKFSASSGGTVWEWGRLSRKLTLDENANPVKFPAGSRGTRFTGQTC